MQWGSPHMRVTRHLSPGCQFLQITPHLQLEALGHTGQVVRLYHPASTWARPRGQWFWVAPPLLISLGILRGVSEALCSASLQSAPRSAFMGSVLCLYTCRDTLRDMQAHSHTHVHTPSLF